MGVDALRSATPTGTGASATSWEYGVTSSKDSYELYWYNTDTTPSGYPIVLLLQYGHAIGSYYYKGHDFINPAIAPVLAKIENALNEEVSKL